MKKYIALLLCLVMVLSLCACGAKENLVGTWKANINMAEAFNAEIAASGDEAMAEAMKLESFDLPLILELREDGTCKLSVDNDAMAASVEKLAEALTNGMKSYFVTMLEEQGLEVEDPDEFLAAMGLDLNTLVEEMKNELLSEDTFGEFTTECKYKAEDGKLYMSDDLESEIPTDEYNTYTLEGDTLTLDVGTMVIEEDMEEMSKYMFPMTLTRAE